MKDRLRAVQRLLVLQEQAKRLAEWELAAIETRQREVAEARESLDRFAEASGLSPSLASVAMRSRRRLAARALAAEGEHAAQKASAMEARGRLKLAERLLEVLTQEDRRLSERQELERLIEAFAAGQASGRASLP